ncbi:molecular chaperone DnaJ, partial [Streptococcus suis]
GMNDRQKAALKEFSAEVNIDVKPHKKGFFDKVKDDFEDL